MENSQKNDVRFFGLILALFCRCNVDDDSRHLLRRYFKVEIWEQLLKDFSLFGNPKSMKFKTRFTKLDEFYKAINALIEWLNTDGHIEEFQKLDTAMVAGATGSEILGNVMLVLKSMKGKYSSELRKEINECLEFALNHRSIFGLDGR